MDDLQQVVHTLRYGDRLPARGDRTGRFSRRAASKLARDLRANLRGEVRFDAGSRAMYAVDASNYRQVPIGVVCPRDPDDVVTAIGICRAHGAPVLGRGGGTSLAGQCCNVAVVFDTSKYMQKVVEIDATSRLATVWPGTVLDRLNAHAHTHGLTFGPDPATHAQCTLGGMIGNNSCGVHAQRSGRTADNVHSLEILTYGGERMWVGETSDEELDAIVRGGGRRGEIHFRLRALRDKYADEIRRRYPAIPRRVSGYSLDELLPERGFHVARSLVGTEGTCVMVLQARLHLLHHYPARATLVLGYPDVFHTGDHLVEIADAGAIGLEGLDDRLFGYVEKKRLDPDGRRLVPEGRGWLLVEFGGETRAEAEEKARALMGRLRRHWNAPGMKLFEDPEEAERVWAIRESGLGATARVPGEKDTWPGWEDSAVPPAMMGKYLRELRTRLDAYGYGCALYGHFGQGCIHTRIDFELKTADGIRKYREFVSEMADVVVGFGGSLSGEHGDGQARAELLPRMFGRELVQAFGEFKGIWDPDGRMNPRKVVDPYKLDENLRFGVGFRRKSPPTHFKFPDDEGSFGYATERCVGVGKCRREGNGPDDTMCPSYMVTREEMHSTRGRAHLLNEMMMGAAFGGKSGAGDGTAPDASPIANGWASEQVHEALDLCLSCKGCKSDCPVNVDIATWKAEFLSHYYRTHLRPRVAWTMGFIQHWARLASLAPALVNGAGRLPVVSGLVKAIAGIAPQRSLPVFAPETFRDWFFRQPRTGTGRPRVILWADTFNDHFHPESAIAAVEVLEHAGYEVIVPRKVLCCGRPLYDFGLLDKAKAYLRGIITTLKPLIDEGVPVVGLEPSCVSVFRDEMRSFFPDDPDAERLRENVHMLSEFLVDQADGWTPPRMEGKALLHGHCHDKSVLRFSSEKRLLEEMGIEVELPESGCCGMAGPFGFERGEKYDVAVKAGERVLLPAVRAASPDTMVITDGFSCREQIEQGSRRKAMHVSEVIRLALHRGERPGITAESSSGEIRRALRPPRRRQLRAAAFAFGAMALVALAPHVVRRAGA